MIWRLHLTTSKVWAAILPKYFGNAIPDTKDEFHTENWEITDYNNCWNRYYVTAWMRKSNFSTPEISCKKICSLQSIKYWRGSCVWICMWSFYIPVLRRKSFLHVSFQGQSTGPNVFQKQCQYLEYPEKMHRPGKNPRDHFTQHEVWVEI